MSMGSLLQTFQDSVSVKKYPMMQRISTVKSLTKPWQTPNISQHTHQLNLGYIVWVVNG